MTETRIRELIARAEALDARARARAFTADGSIGFGSRAPSHGHEGIEKALVGLFELLDGVRVALLALGPVPEGWVIETELSCSVKGVAAPVVVRGAVVIRIDGDRLRDVRVYCDFAPVFAAAQWASLRDAAC